MHSQHDTCIQFAQTAIPAFIKVRLLRYCYTASMPVIKRTAIPVIKVHSHHTSIQGTEAAILVFKVRSQHACVQGTQADIPVIKVRIMCSGCTGRLTCIQGAQAGMPVMNVHSQNHVFRVHRQTNLYSRCPCRHTCFECAQPASYVQGAQAD